MVNGTWYSYSCTVSYDRLPRWQLGAIRSRITSLHCSWSICFVNADDCHFFVPDADQGTPLVTTAYRTLSRQHHPDKAGNSEEANRVMGELAAANAAIQSSLDTDLELGEFLD